MSGERINDDVPPSKADPQRASYHSKHRLRPDTPIPAAVFAPYSAHLKARDFAPAELLAAQPVAQLQFPQWVRLPAGGNTACHDGRPWAYALDIAAWALCQACTTSADSRPRSLTL